MHVVVLRLAHLYNTLKSVVTGQASITLEQEISSGVDQIKQKIIHTIAATNRRIDSVQKLYIAKYVFGT